MSRWSPPSLNKVCPLNSPHYYLYYLEALNVRETVAEGLSELIFAICSSVNRWQFVPKMPAKSQIDSVFDTRFEDVQPYAFRTIHSADEMADTGVLSAWNLN